MPSRNAYSYLPLDGTMPRLMNVENNQEKEHILLAVNLCRIIVRALEVHAFRSLQKRLFDLSQKKSSESERHLPLLAKQLGEILFRLRWRISWWAVFGLGDDDGSTRKYTERITMLTQTLYYWYLAVKEKRPSWQESPAKVSIKYADTTNAIFEEYPEEASEEGFRAWMAHGPALIRQVSLKVPLPRPPPQY